MLGCVSLSLQLHYLLGVLLWRVLLFCLAFQDLRYVYFVQLLLAFIEFLLKLFATGLLLGKCLHIKFRKSLQIFDATHLLKGGLDQVIFLFLCFGLLFGGVYFNICL